MTKTLLENMVTFSLDHQIIHDIVIVLASNLLVCTNLHTRVVLKQSSYRKYVETVPSDILLVDGNIANAANQ